MKIRIGPPARATRLTRAGWIAAGGQALLVLFLCFRGEALSREQLALSTALQLVCTATLTVVLRSLASYEDFVERVQARELRAERLATIAALSAGAAHELSTPLSTIAVAASELARAGGASDDARLIREQVDRCKALLQQMADEGGSELHDAPSRITVAELVGAASVRLGEARRIRTEWNEAEDARAELIVPVRATTRALRNLLKNALDASPSDEHVRLRVWRSSGGDFVFEVCDRGPGIAGDVIRRVAEPFFTTKRDGAGMGLGLYLTASVLELLGGHLEIESESGRGTRVLCTLPASAAVT